MDTKGNLPLGVGLSVEEQKSKFSVKTTLKKFHCERKKRNDTLESEDEEESRKAFLLVFKKFMLLPMIASEFF